jgi:hypothetical protein
MKPAIVRELVILENSFPDPDAISYICNGTEEQSLNALLGLFVALLKRYKTLVKLTVGLAVVSTALFCALIYLLVR